jgi:serine phosphatase RsbU (regulator of sigma subunit)
MQATYDTTAQKPSWIVFEMPKVFRGMDLSSQATNSVANELIAAQLLSDGQQAIQDLEDVKRVNARLFPHQLPQLASVAYAGVCIEARYAGGDFYDFFDCGPHRLGLAVGDVSGKGVASALLRATLQASLRTLRLTGLDDLEGQLTLANRLLLESAPEAMYASLFFAEYDERSWRLRYVNCGHPAPALLRDGKILWLQPTATVLGLFNDWGCSIAEVQLQPGDTLLLYTDGVTEATNSAGDEFGPDRLLALLNVHEHVPVSMLLQECMNGVRRFAQGSLCDDVTLVALRCLEQES